MQALDYLVLASYFAIVAAIGLIAGRRQNTTEDFLLGGRQIPWWAAGLSIIATETSALTFIGAPTQSLRGDWTYVQLAIGSVAARFIIAWLLIPAYYKAQVFTVYGWARAALWCADEERGDAALLRRSIARERRATLRRRDRVRAARP